MTKLERAIAELLSRLDDAISTAFVLDPIGEVRYRLVLELNILPDALAMGKRDNARMLNVLDEIVLIL